MTRSNGIIPVESNCTSNVILNYMNGTLPIEPGNGANDDQFVVCPTNQSLLGDCAFPRFPLIVLRN